MYLISVIMPIFNAEKYLEKAINSVINQTIGFENIELILVDDASTDNSRIIIEKYSKKYDNIISVYFDKNSGSPSPVRNKGIDIATSSYLMFIDSDDEYEMDVCEKLYNALVENECDSVGCNYRLLEVNDKTESIESFEISLSPENISYYVIWNKIFKKSIIVNNNIKFEGNVGEDIIFCMKFLLNSHNFIHLNYFGYRYFNRNESFSTENSEWILSVIDNYYDIINLIEEYDRTYFNFNKNKFFSSRVQDIIVSLFNIDEENKFFTISKILYKLYLFEKDINLNDQPPFLLVRIINNIVLKNHISIATSLVLIINKINKNGFLLKIYRKF